MRRKVIVFLATVSVVCLSAICMLWHKGQKTDDGLKKRKEESITQRNAGQGAVQEIKQKLAQQKWVVTEDIQGSMGPNLSRAGRFLLEEGGSLFVAGLYLDAAVAVYGGEDVPEKETYNIYCLKDGIWEVFASHPPESTGNGIIERHNNYDETFIQNMVYHDGFLYYDVLYDDDPSIGGDKMMFIYRIPVQGGKAEELALSYERFSFYNGKIYYAGAEKVRWSQEDVFWEMEPDGTGRREIYRRNENMSYKRLFTVGGGCLYVEDKKGMTVVNLETGDRKHYKAAWENMKYLYYQAGCLYFLADYGMTSSIYRMNIISCKTEKLAESVDAAWLEGGYLYYIWYDSVGEKLNLSVLDLETKQSFTEELEEPVISTPYLQTVGNDILVNMQVYDEYKYKEYLFEVEKYVYYKYGSNTLQLERLDRQEVPAENP